LDGNLAIQVLPRMGYGIEDIHQQMKRVELGLCR